MTAPLHLPTFSLIILLFLPRAECTPTIDLERAHYYEYTVGDITSAKKIYQQLLSSPKAALRWKAEAHCGLARIHVTDENYVAANKHYLQVIRRYAFCRDLVEVSSREIIDISQLMADENSSVQEIEYLYLSELATTLSMAYLQADENLAHQITDELKKLLTKLSNNAEDGTDKEIIEKMGAELTQVSTAETMQLSDRAELLDNSENLGIYVGAITEEQSGRLFDPLLRWKDLLAIAIADGDEQSAILLAKKMIGYLKFYPEIQDQDVKLYAGGLLAQAKAVLKALQNKNLKSAVNHFFQAEKKRYEIGAVVTIWVDDTEDLPIIAYPSIYICNSWMKNAATHLDSSTQRALEALDKAAKSLRKAQLHLKESEGYPLLDQTEKQINESISLIKSGKIAEAKELLDNQ